MMPKIVEVPIEDFEAKMELIKESEKKHDQSSTSGAKSSSQKSTTMS